MDAFLFTACSHAAGTGTGGGWIAVSGDAIAYGGSALNGVERIAEAECAAAVGGVRAAAEAFPGLARILLSADGNEVRFAPWGDIADGMDDALDPTGLLATCRALGVAHAVRWWPGNRPGPLAPDALLLAARALAIQARRGVPLHGRLDLAADWRSSLVDAIGAGPLDGAPRTAGLDRDQACSLTGLDAARVRILADAGRLRAAPRGGIALSSALEVRDALVREGIVSWPGDDFGASHLAASDRPDRMRLCTGMHVQGDGYGIAIARRRGGLVEVSAETFHVGGGEDAFKAATATAIAILARTVREADGPGPIDVVTTQPWLATLLTEFAEPSEAVAGSLADLREASARKGIEIRPRLARDGRVRPWNGNEALGLLDCAQAAARIAGVGIPYAARTWHPHEGPDALLPRIEAKAIRVGAERTRADQDAVTGALFDLVPSEPAMRSRFETLCRDTHATYRGTGTVLRPILPAPVEGRVGISSEAGARPCSPHFGIDAALAGRWEAWWIDYAHLLSRHPVLALREAVLRLDGRLDIDRWDDLRIQDFDAWITGAGDCPFRVHAERMAPARSEILALVEACGGWPFGGSAGIPAEPPGVAA